EVDLVGIDSETRSEDEGQRRSADAQTESTQTGASRSGEKGGLGGSTATMVEDAVPTGAVNWRMPFSLGVLILMIVGFSTGLADIATVAMVGALILIASGCLPFKEALKRIDWNTIIILSAAQAFGAGLTQSGGGQLVADWITGLLGGISGEWLILLFLCLVPMILTNFASNVALTAMFVPIGMSVAASIGADPTSWAIAITLACNIAVFTPIGTPCMTQTLLAKSRHTDSSKIGADPTRCAIAITLACTIAVFTPIGTPCMTQTLVAKLRYTDYIKIGLPLAVILTVVATLLSLVVYP